VRDMFRSNPNKDTLVDQLDVQIEEYRRKSRLLRGEHKRFRTESAELIEDGMERAAKKRFTSAIVCLRQREKIEDLISDLQTARLQLMMQSDRPTHVTLEGVNELLKKAQVEAQRSEKAIYNISAGIEIGLDEPDTIETYGFMSSTLDDEFAKFKQEQGFSVAPAPQPQRQEVSEAPFPTVPHSTTAEPRAEEKPEEEKKEEKDKLKEV
jgi:hypothetical protein